MHFSLIQEHIVFTDRYIWGETCFGTVETLLILQTHILMTGQWTKGECYIIHGEY